MQDSNPYLKLANINLFRPETAVKVFAKSEIVRVDYLRKKRCTRLQDNELYQSLLWRVFLCRNNELWHDRLIQLSIHLSYLINPIREHTNRHKLKRNTVKNACNGRHEKPLMTLRPQMYFRYSFFSKGEKYFVKHADYSISCYYPLVEYFHIRFAAKILGFETDITSAVI